MTAAVHSATGQPVTLADRARRVSAVACFLAEITEWGWPDARCRRAVADNSHHDGYRAPAPSGPSHRQCCHLSSHHRRCRPHLGPRRLRDTVHRPGVRSRSAQQKSSSPASAHTGRVWLKQAADIMVYLGGPARPGDRAAVTVPRDSLAAVLAVAEKCVASHRDRARQSAEVLAALAELRAALPDAAARSEKANETKLRQGGRRKDEQDRPASRRRRSHRRRMRDSNSRGLAPNTLSKRAPQDGAVRTFRIAVPGTAPNPGTLRISSATTAAPRPRTPQDRTQIIPICALRQPNRPGI